MLTKSGILACAAALLAIFTAAIPASAHPHVWVDVKTAVVYEAGRIAAFEHAWTFDEGYATMAIEGLDKNGDGAYDREELAELAQVNIEGLKEFDYFTYPKIGEIALKTGAPVDYWLEYTNGILTLHFTLPLADPVLAGAQGFSFQVMDPSFYIAFELAKESPVTLAAGAPAGCKADVSLPADETDDAKKLGDAFLQQFGGDIGIGMARIVSISCPAS
ncbi:MAG: hypothetical protein APF80_06605 [Alphaproteobacteria bacterium BRH_c36]|nr:MAG: hypothetical protein APF80_06605 [Alphaproteobacteria bacterium BRH_c36]